MTLMTPKNYDTPSVTWFISKFKYIKLYLPHNFCMQISLRWHSIDERIT